MEVFKKINVDFDYMKLRNDVNHVYHTIKEQAVGTQYEALAYRNICITTSKPDSDEWTDGIAGKTYVNKTEAQGKQGVLATQIGDDSNEMIDEIITTIEDEVSLIIYVFYFEIMVKFV